MIALLGGDVRTALDFATRAGDTGEESGYFRASVGALINQAHVLHSIGKLPSARQLAEIAVSRSGDHRQLRVAALDCLANILVASAGFRRGGFRVRRDHSLAAAARHPPGASLGRPVRALLPSLSCEDPERACRIGTRWWSQGLKTAESSSGQNMVNANATGAGDVVSACRRHRTGAGAADERSLLRLTPLRSSSPEPPPHGRLRP